jgi:hypothetical protein
MFSIPAKRSENLHLSSLIETHLAKTLDSLMMDKVRPFLMAMNSYREAFSSASDSTNLDFLVRSLELYYSALVGIESRLYLERTSIQIVWQDSYSGKSQTFDSFQMEKIAVLYSLGSLWSRIGNCSDLKSPTGHKLALNAFQTAFGLLNNCQENLNSLNQLKDFNDLNAHNLTLWMEVMKASGYLTMFDKLDKMNASKINLQKLAFTIHKRLDSAVSHLHLVPGFPKDIEKIMRFATDLFLAVTEFYSGLIQKEKVSATGKGFGEAVARLRKSNDLCKKCEGVKGITGKPSDLLKEFILLIKSETTKAEDENYSIYMESIPTDVPWSIVEEVTLFKGKDPEIKHFPEKDLINLLQPVEVQALHEEYEQRMTQEFQKTSEKVEKELEKFEKFFNASTFKGLPQHLWSQISAQQVQTIEKQIENLHSLCQSCISELVKSRDKLMAEEADDEENRTKFPSEYKVVPSCICNADFKIEIQKTLKSIQESQTDDASLINEFREQENKFKELSENREHFDRLIPKLDLQKETEKDLLVASINEAAQVLRKSLSQLKGSIFRKANYETLKKIYKERQDKETVFNEIRVEISYFQIEIEKILEKTTPKIEKFFKEYAGLSVENRAGNLLKNLSKLLEKKQKIAQKFDERLAVYSSFLDDVNKVSGKVDEFLVKRMNEKQDILGRQTSDKRAFMRFSNAVGSSNFFKPEFPPKP